MITMAPPASIDAPDQASRLPRATDGGGANSMLVPTIGLTSFGSLSSSSKKDPPISREVSSQPSAGAARDTQDEDGSNFGNTRNLKPSMIMSMTAVATMPSRPEAMAVVAPPSFSQFNPSDIRQTHSALTAAAARTPGRALRKPMPSPLVTCPWPAGFQAHPTAPPLFDRTIVATMGRAPAAVVANRLLPYEPHHPPQASLLPLPTPHNASTPLDNNSFPMTLFDVISSQEHAHIISWLPHGKGFVIHDKERFASTIMPRYFQATKFTSFTRRLKRWGFVRVPRGPEHGAYYRMNFVQGGLEMVRKMSHHAVGQFKKEEARAKIKDKKEENKDLKKQTKKEVESKVQLKLSETEALARHPTSMFESQEAHEVPQSQALPAYAPSPASKTAHTVSHQGYPVPTVTKTMPKNFITSNALPSLLPMYHPGDQHLVRIQRELLLSQSIRYNEVTPRGLRLMPNEGFVDGRMSDHRCYPEAPTAQRICNPERAGHVLEAAGRDLRQSHRNCINSNHSGREMMAPDVLDLARMHQEMHGTAVQDAGSRLAPPLVQSMEHPPPRSEDSDRINRVSNAHLSTSRSPPWRAGF